MKTVIQIIEKSTGIIYKEISTIEQLMKFLEAEVMHEDFQRRTAIENLFLKSKFAPLSAQIYFFKYDCKATVHQDTEGIVPCRCCHLRE